jgi:hypothetical protein
MFRIVVAVLMFASLAASAGAQRKPKPSTPAASQSSEDAIKKLEQRWLDALIARDQASVAEILAPEFQDTMIDGKIHNRDQALAAVLDTTRPALTRFFGRLEVKVYEGRFAVAHGLTVVNGEKIHEAHIVFTDVFVLRGGKWQAVAAQEALENY